MPFDRIDQVRSWARENEPLLRLVEVVCVIVFGCILTVVVSWQQTRIANKELEVAELQLRLSQAALPPEIEISGGSGPETTWVQAISHRADIKLHYGGSTLFVEQDYPDGTSRRVAVPDFYQSGNAKAPNLVQFETSTDADLSATYKFMFTRGSDVPDAFEKSYFRNDRRVKYCFVVEYFNAVGDKVRSWFVSEHPQGFPHSVDAEPKYDARIWMSETKLPSGKGCDFAKLNAKIEDALKPSK